MKRLILFLTTVAWFIFNTATHSFAGEISTPSPLSFLAFEKYHVISTQMEGNSLTRDFQVEVKNTSDRHLKNIRFFLDSCPSTSVCSEYPLMIGDLEPGASVLSSDTVQVSMVDTTTESSELKLIWRVECEINGQFILDEVAVIENLSELGGYHDENN